jgi:hypothetical protein
MTMIVSALVDRIRGASDAHEALRALRGFVDQSRGLRITFYENETRLSEVFAQRRGNVSEVLSGEDLSTEISGGYMSFVAGKASRRTSISEKIEMSSIMKAILLEETEKELGRLVELDWQPPVAGHLLKHIGHAWLCGPWDAELTNAEMEQVLGADAIMAIERARADQNEKLGWGKPNSPGTIVWAAKPTRALAAIGSFDWAIQDSLVSFGPRPPIGFLGLLEAELESCVLLSPLAIWHQSVREEIDEPLS